MPSTRLARNAFLTVPDRDPSAFRNGGADEAAAPPEERGPFDWLHHPGTAAPEAIGREGYRDDRHALAVFCHEAPDSFVGRYASAVVAALARRGVLVHLFSRHEFEFKADDVVVHAVGEFEGIDLLEEVEEFTRRASNAFLRQFPNGGPPVTLLGFEWTSAPALSLLHGIKEIPVILSLHSLERQRSDLSQEISRKIEEIEMGGLREARTILIHDAATAEIAKSRVPEVADRIVLARQPFPAPQFECTLDPAAVKARFQVGPVDPTIVCVGDLSDRYGQDLLVKALPPILKNHPQTRLVVVGEGALFWPLRVYARYLLLEHAVRLAGSVQGQALAELIAAADVVVVPSREQTPWWPVLAAWAARRPVVATHNAAPGLVSHEQDGVLCYPSENSLVWGVERLLYDADLCARMADKGRDKLEERFGWNIVAEQVQELMNATTRT